MIRNLLRMLSDDREKSKDPLVVVNVQVSGAIVLAIVIVGVILLKYFG